MSENDIEDKAAESPRASAPDIDLVDAGDWPNREFPIDDGRRENSVRVVIKQSVLNDIHRHGQSDTDVEICGVLIGNGYRDDRGPYVYVEGNIRGAHSDSKAAQVTFTGETWNHIHNELDRDFPELQILGWYHTHPGFGIFLSGMDLFIHESYFSGEHHLALVYDPVGGDEGLFVWRGGKAVRDGFLIEPDAEEDPPPVTAEPPSEPMTAGAEMSVSSEETAVDPDLNKRLTRIENRLMLAEVGLFAAVGLAVIVPLLIWVLWIRPQMPRAGTPRIDQRPRGGALAPPQADTPTNAPGEKRNENKEPDETKSSQRNSTPEENPTDDGEPKPTDGAVDDKPPNDGDGAEATVPANSSADGAQGGDASGGGESNTPPGEDHPQTDSPSP